MLTQSGLQLVIAASNEAKQNRTGIGFVDIHWAVLDHLIDAHKVAKEVKEFITTNNISCGESIYQSDEVMFKLPELIERLCELVGYHKTNKGS